MEMLKQKFLIYLLSLEDQTSARNKKTDGRRAVRKAKKQSFLFSVASCRNTVLNFKRSRRQWNKLSVSST